MKNKKGELLESSPVEMHKRMAKEFAKIEKNINVNGIVLDMAYHFRNLFLRFKIQRTTLTWQNVHLTICFD